MEAEEAIMDNTIKQTRNNFQPE